MKILHFSDTHAQGETFQALDNLARAHKNCDVVACTVDNTTARGDLAPTSWNQWLQHLIIAVQPLAVYGIVLCSYHDNILIPKRWESSCYVKYPVFIIGSPSAVVTIPDDFRGLLCFTNKGA